MVIQAAWGVTVFHVAPLREEHARWVMVLFGLKHIHTKLMPHFFALGEGVENFGWERAEGGIYSLWQTPPPWPTWGSKLDP